MWNHSIALAVPAASSSARAGSCGRLGRPDTPRPDTSPPLPVSSSTSLRFSFAPSTS